MSECVEAQVLVQHGNRTRVLRFGGCARVTVSQVLRCLEDLDGVPAASLALQHGPRRLGLGLGRGARALTSWRAGRR